MGPDAPRSSAFRPGVWEVAVACVAVALSLRVLHEAGEGAGFRGADPVAYALTALGAASTVWARRQPLPALVIVGACTTALSWLDHHVDVLPFVVTGLLFMVASYRPLRGAALGLGLALAFLALSAASRPADLGPQVTAQSVVIFSAAWALGRAARAHRETLLALVTAAEQREEAQRRLAAADADRQALTAVEERLRIARELHDVLAHSISVISVQATVGEHLAANDPAAARRALVTIGTVSRASLHELRQMLTLLRDASVPQSSADATYQPARGLVDLEWLMDTYRSAGLPVAASRSGVVRPLFPAADLCAYRIVQEALTNTLKHAGPSSASVELRYDDEVLRVVVTDDGVGSASSGTGHGLIGMRERAALLGGRLDAVAGQSGGFTVTAIIPYGSAVEPVA
jgi:signal transduction histidine kinase